MMHIYRVFFSVPKSYLNVMGSTHFITNYTIQLDEIMVKLTCYVLFSLLNWRSIFFKYCSA